MSARSRVQAFFDSRTATVSYVVSDTATGCAALVDPVLDFDFKSGHTSTRAADSVLDYLRAEKLDVPTRQ